MEKFHNEIMTTVFMGKNKVLVYMTPEQWEVVSGGGKISNALTGIARQAWTAGQNAPKVTL